jgi:hypothetical protein
MLFVRINRFPGLAAFCVEIDVAEHSKRSALVNRPALRSLARSLKQTLCVSGSSRQASAPARDVTLVGSIRDGEQIGAMLIL